jgi:hypothetical protein
VLPTLVAAVGPQPVAPWPLSKLSGQRNAVVNGKHCATTNKLLRRVDPFARLLNQRHTGAQCRIPEELSGWGVKWGRERLSRTTISITADVGLAPSVIEDGETERKIIKELIRDHDTVKWCGRHRRCRFDVFRVPVALAGRELNGDEPHGVETAWLRRCNGTGQGARTGTHVDHRELGRLTNALPDRIKVIGDDRAEERAHFGRRQKIAPPTGMTAVRLGIETGLAIQSVSHELVKGHHVAKSSRNLLRNVPEISNPPRFSNRWQASVSVRQAVGVRFFRTVGLWSATLALLAACGPDAARDAAVPGAPAGGTTRLSVSTVAVLTTTATSTTAVATASTLATTPSTLANIETTVPATTVAEPTTAVAPDTTVPPTTQLVPTTIELVYTAEATEGALKFGDQGPRTQQLQAALITLGHLPTGADDGLFGPGTAGGVRRFQEVSELVVDGVAGPVTLAGVARASAALNAGA